MTDPAPEPRPDPRSREEILKAQQMMVVIFAVATLVPSLWMVLMAYNGIALGQEDAGFAQVLTYWGLAAPLVWLAANGVALFKIRQGEGEGAKYFPLIPAFWAIVWFAAQVTG